MASALIQPGTHVSGKKNRTKRTTLKNKADRLFSQYIRQRDGGCVACLSVENLQCAHIFTRSYLNTRFDEDNAVCLCAGCHKFYTHRPIEWSDFIIARIGEEKYQDVRMRAVSTDTRIDYEAVIEVLQRRLGASR